jgi:hypothetical protein
MRSIISQSVVLPAPAERLFAMYIDSAKHAAITGAPVANGVSALAGAQAGAQLHDRHDVTEENDMLLGEPAGRQRQER